MVPKNKNSQLRKWAKKLDGQIEIIRTWKDSFDIINNSVPEEPQVPKIVENKEISINHVMDEIRWNQSKVKVDDVVAYSIVLVLNDIEDQESKLINDFW